MARGKGGGGRVVTTCWNTKKDVHDGCLGTSKDVRGIWDIPPNNYGPNAILIFKAQFKYINIFPYYSWQSTMSLPYPTLPYPTLTFTLDKCFFCFLGPNLGCCFIIHEELVEAQKVPAIYRVKFCRFHTVVVLITS